MYSMDDLKIEQAGHWRVPCRMNKFPRVLIIPMRPWWAKDQDVTRLHIKTIPDDLIWSESAQWLLSSSSHKIPRAFMMPRDTPIMPPWANYHDIAHLQAETVLMSLIWSESANCLWSCGTRKVPGALIMPMGMSILWTHGLMIVMLHT